MRNRLKFLGILLMSLMLVISCGKDNDQNKTEENVDDKVENWEKDNNSEVYKLIKDQENLTYNFVFKESETDPVIYNGGLMMYNAKLYFKQIKKILVKDKVYKKVEKTSNEIYAITSNSKITISFIDEPIIHFDISKDGKQVLVRKIVENKMTDVFELEGTFDVDELLKVIDEIEDRFSL